jgi:pantetheine-phosphate adenylyltransferase
MRRAIYPGSFDPLTNGHLDIIERAAKLFDEIIVAVLDNPDKSALFTPVERYAMIKEVLPAVNSHNCLISVDSFQGLLVEYATTKNAKAIVRGIRAISDYEYELQMALMNRRLAPHLETVFLMSAEDYSYVSSRLVKQIFALGGKIDGLVSPLVKESMRRKLTANEHRET